MFQTPIFPDLIHQSGVDHPHALGRGSQRGGLGSLLRPVRPTNNSLWGVRRIGPLRTPAFAAPDGSPLLSRIVLTLKARRVRPTICAMLLTISTTHQPATDLGFLMHKNPGRFQSFTLPFGRADVFYPEAECGRCTVALFLVIDPIGLVRPKPGAPSTGGWLQQFVNDRPYVASSHLSVAIASVFGSALAGKSQERPELAESTIPLEARIEVVPSREGADLIRSLFEPLGYIVEIQGHPLDGRFPEWGASPYFSVRLTSETRLRDLLAHLYVLLPVLDDDKHYWVGDDEVAKLLRFGEGWLSSPSAAGPHLGPIPEASAQPC